MVTVKVDADKAIKGMNNLIKNIRPDIEQTLDHLASATSGKMKSEAPKGLSRGLSNKVNVVSRQMYREIEPVAPNLSGKKYAYYIEKGTGPGYTPNVWNIQKYYGVDVGTAWAIAKSIKDKGTRADPFVERTFDYMLNKLPYYAGDFLNKISTAFMEG